MTVVGQRVYLLNGWTAEAAVKVSEGVVLDMEEEREKSRRVAAEFAARLDRERWVSVKVEVEVEIEVEMEIVVERERVGRRDREI